MSALLKAIVDHMELLREEMKSKDVNHVSADIAKSIESRISGMFGKKELDKFKNMDKDKDDDFDSDVWDEGGQLETKKGSNPL